MFSSERNKDPRDPPLALVPEFLTELYESGLGYSAMNTATLGGAGLSFPENLVCQIESFEVDQVATA